jgi:hypothetical protein
MKLKCIKPTKTLTEGKIYKGILLTDYKTVYVSTNKLENAIFFVTMSDTGVKQSYRANRFVKEID